MPKPTEIAVLEVNGQRYQDWETVMVRHSAKEHPFYHYRFTCSEGMPLAKNFAALRIKPGDECTVYLAGEHAISGLVHTRQVFYDAKRHYIELQGASDVQPLASSSAITKTMEHKNVTWEQHARALIKPFGINLKVVGGEIPKLKFPRLSIAPGMTVLEALELPLRNLGGCFLTSNPQGDLVVVAGEIGGEDIVIEGKNILEGREIIYNSGMASGTYLLTQGPGTDKKHGAEVAHVPFNARPFQGLGNQYSPGILRHDLPITEDGHLKGRTNLEHDMMNEDRVTVFITVQGWLKPSGGLWKLNEDVKVKSPMLLLNGSEKLTARVITFTQDNERGSRTVLELMNENAFMEGVPGKSGSQSDTSGVTADEAQRRQV